MARAAPDNGAPENRSIRQSATTGPPPAPGVLLLDGHAKRPRELLGNKGYGIDAMRRHGFPVPPAFCITTEVGARYLAEPESTMDAIWHDVLDRVSWLEAETSRTFGRGPRPLLVSVRSGAAQSMPGMMDTVLNSGMNDAVEQALAELSSFEFARDTRQRFTRTYRRIVAGRERARHAGPDTESVPADPYAQLRNAIEAVFASWNSPRAIAYRRHHRLNDRAGTAVVVQAMVFGNMGTDSGAGVVFSRNPITGADEPFGEWLPGGQGDDVVSGRVDVEPISTLHDEQPSVYDELMAAARSLDRLGADVQEIEFTVEEGKLWLLQTRAAERSAQAAVRLALQLRREELIDDTETLRRVTPAHIESLLQTSLQRETRLAAPLLAKGLPACPGVASGKVYIEAGQALAAADRGEQVILVRDYTRPDDVAAMLAARGIVTEVGGASSHAAVVSRELGRVAVVGCGHGVAASLAGKLVTVDGNEGEVREGNLELSTWSANDTPELRELADIARRISPLRTHTDEVSVAPLIAMLTELQLAGKEDADVSEYRSAALDCDAMRELTVLQAVRLKGRLNSTDLAATLSEGLASVTKTVEKLTASGLLLDGTTLKISDEGRVRLGELLAQERNGIDSAALAAAYNDFRTFNRDFKALITDWQLKDGEPNTHDNTEYDAAVLARIDRVHQRVLPTIAAAAAQVPRLRAYSAKLQQALDKVKAGDIAWLTRPSVDSYHTVWFELHEELILAAGLTRAGEAKAGHAQ